MGAIYYILCLLSLSFSLSSADADGPDYWRVFRVAPDDVLWMHSKPDYLSPQIGRLPFNTRCIKTIECTGNISFTEFMKLSPQQQKQLKYRTRWCKVRYGKKEGWVNANFLREDGRCPNPYLFKKRSAISPAQK
jgi:hypothetical protein